MPTVFWESTSKREPGDFVYYIYFFDWSDTVRWSSLKMRIVLPFSNGYSSLFGFMQLIQGVTSATFWEQNGSLRSHQAFFEKLAASQKKLDRQNLN
ncbi:MAG: hypothetical protein HW415_306 [Deltaproteobacteria bacterium]|nr:hypothetical protein [Deltaproteobacteria bacterium]